jgi:subtilase family serine protease
VTAVVTVRNQGTGPAGPSLVGLYLGASSGSPLTSAIPLGTIAVGALAPGASQAVSSSFTVPGVAPGTFSVIAVVDGATTLLESSETNNRRTASLRVTLADLTVARVTLAPSHARTGDTVTATAVIRNGGQVPAQASAVRLLFETGAGAPPAVVGSRSTEPLAAGESRELSFTFTVPSVPARRAYYVWAQVDADGGLLETNEGNNRNGAWLDVTIPDLTISGLSLRPAPARAGDPVSAIVVVRNSSPVPAGGTTLRLYFETAAGAPASPPTLLGTATVAWLNPGESREMSLSFTVPAVPHGRSYYVWAQVDAEGGLLETNEGNNRRGSWLSVTIPDLTIASLAVRPAPARARPRRRPGRGRHRRPEQRPGPRQRQLAAPLLRDRRRHTPDPAGDRRGGDPESRAGARAVGPVHGPGRAAWPLVLRVGAGRRRGRPPRDQRGQQPPRQLAQRDHPGPHHHQPRGAARARPRR